MLRWLTAGESHGPALVAVGFGAAVKGDGVWCGQTAQGGRGIGYELAGGCGFCRGGQRGRDAGQHSGEGLDLEVGFYLITN